MSTEQGAESSCSSASLKGNESLRMREIAQIMMNNGKPPMSAMAKMMLGKPTVQELDADWYETSESTRQNYQGQVCSDLMRIRDLVDDTYHFPTAIIVQTPQPGVYLALGQWPSTVFEGIQMARVLAMKGYTQEASTLLLGGDVALSRRLSSITRGLRPGERVEIPLDAPGVPDEIKEQFKMVIPLLRGGTPPPPPSREEIRNAKWKKEHQEETRRKRAIQKKQAQEKRKRRKKKKARKKKEGRWRTTNILNLI